QLSGFHHLDGSSFFSGLGGHGWLTVYIAYSFLLTWNVIAMEAAACYIGECKDPERDAKIAMNLEGAYGLFIYTPIPIAFILVVVLAGGAVEIYSFSNVGYTFSFLPVLVGYYLLRKYKPNANRPVRLPEFMKYVALAMAVFYFIIWIYGGIYYSKIGHTLVYYLAGWGVLAAYLPLYWYRVKVEDKKTAPEAPAAMPAAG